MNGEDKGKASVKAERESPNSSGVDGARTEGEAVVALQKLAEKSPGRIMEIMQMEMSSMGNPLHSKMTEQHVSKVIEIAACRDERQYALHKASLENEHEDNRSTRRYGFWAFFLVLVLICVVLLLFRDTPEVLVPLVTGIFAFGAGFAGGWGVGKTRQ